jgi:hypothetical protein
MAASFIHELALVFENLAVLCLDLVVVLVDAIVLLVDFHIHAQHDLPIPLEFLHLLVDQVTRESGVIDRILILFLRKPGLLRGLDMLMLGSEGAIVVDIGKVEEVTLILNNMHKELHDIRSIRGYLPLHHDIVHLLENEVHDIDLLINHVPLTIVEHMVGVVEEVDEATPEWIIVARTW